jgi:hypothetical protein
VAAVDGLIVISTIGGGVLLWGIMRKKTDTTLVEQGAAPNNRPRSQLPTSPDVQSPNSQRDA